MAKYCTMFTIAIVAEELLAQVCRILLYSKQAFALMS